MNRNNYMSVEIKSLKPYAKRRNTSNGKDKEQPLSILYKKSKVAKSKSNEKKTL